jgi:carboxymethylenebutenolidase
MSSTFQVTAEDGHSFTTYAAGAPETPVALVLCDSLPGNTPHAHRMADRLAAFGYRVLAPSLTDRVDPAAKLSYRPGELARSKEIREKLGGLVVMQDIAATAATIGHERIGIIGFGWGATAAWHAATRLHIFRAAVGFYGGGIASARQQTPTCPVQLFFAEGDLSIPLGDAEAIRRAQPEVKITIYPGSHGFACEEQEVFHPDSWFAARDDALGFFRRHL